MDDSRLSGCSFQFTEAERETVRNAFGKFAPSGGADRADAVEAFIDELATHVIVASQMPTPVHGPTIKRAEAVKKAVRKLRVALHALTDDDQGEFIVYSRASIVQVIQEVQYRLPILTTAADKVLEKLTPNQHAHHRYGSSELMILVAARAWRYHFRRIPSVSKGSSATYGFRLSPFVRVVQAVLEILGWPAGYDFIESRFAHIRYEIKM